MNLYANRAADTLAYYAENHGVGSDSGLDESTITDLITDLIHLVGQDLFSELTRNANIFYTEVDDRDE